MAGPLKLEVMQGLLAVLLLLCTQRPVLSIPITGTAFPFETCKVSQLRGRYQTYLSRYFKLPEDEGWTFCLTTQVLPRDQCYINAAFPRNTTRCCDTNFDMLKVYPSDACTSSIAYVLTNGGWVMHPSR
ncbi:hypothetical protein V8C86DRAFT_2849031 [Haematococcus lacustris]